MVGRTAMCRLLTVGIALLVMSCGKDEAQMPTPDNEKVMTRKFDITIGDQTLSVVPAENSAVETLMAELEEHPITYEADDYGDFEKVGTLGLSLPVSDRQITTQAGDVVLYNDNQIVLFYGSNTWRYTRLGRIDHESTEQLRTFLQAGQGRVGVTLSVGTGDLGR